MMIHVITTYLIARFYKLQIEEASIGVGPTLLSKKMDDHNLLIRALPIGGYVKTTEGSLCKLSLLQKINYAILAYILMVAIGLFLMSPTYSIGHLFNGFYGILFHPFSVGPKTYEVIMGLYHVDIVKYCGIIIAVFGMVHLIPISVTGAGVILVELFPALKIGVCSRVYGVVSIIIGLLFVFGNFVSYIKS